MFLNHRLTQLNEAASVALADRVRRLKQTGRKVIGLQTGDPDFATPQGILDAAYNAMNQGNTHYCDSRGIPQLRIAVSEKLAKKNHVNYDPAAEVLVTCGGVHAYYCGLLSIINPGDEVLIPDPAWMTHVNIVTLVGGRAVRVPSENENNFLPSFDEWEKAVTSRTVALVFNSPNNPTGTVATSDYLNDLNTFAAVHNLYVVSDEVYESILFDGHKHICFSSLPGAQERTLLINSLSKTYAMTGWRVGYLAAPSHIINQSLKVSQNSITNLSPFVQQAAVFALSDSGVDEAVRKMTAKYSLRRAMVMNLFQEYRPTKACFMEPQGAFYFFIDVRPLSLPSVKIAEKLLEEASVALIPGSAYGRCGEGFLRMTIAADDKDIENGCRGLLHWVQKQT